MVLLPPPVTEATEEEVGEEPVDGVADDVDVDGLLYPESDRDKDKDVRTCEIAEYEDKTVFNITRATW